MNCTMEQYMPSKMGMQIILVFQEVVALGLTAYLVHGYRRALKGNVLAMLIIMNLCFTIFIIMGFFDYVQNTLALNVIRDL